MSAMKHLCYFKRETISQKLFSVAEKEWVAAAVIGASALFAATRASPLVIINRMGGVRTRCRGEDQHKSIA